MSKARSSGKTAMSYARKWVAKTWPGAPICEAQQAISWIPNKKKPKGPRIPITRQEDMFGVFDMIVQPDGLHPLYIQVTTQDDSHSTVSHRKRKIREWVGAHYGKFFGAQQFFRIYLVAWVAREHIRIWQWSWGRNDWVERESIPLRVLNREIS